ncbi:Uncharacterized protein Adt_11615 [Abeliophyllum distichum]|uniref:DUF4283 domain-containing protein n=1 Tax=Abeliophyllum distichum TaxID=126358 RepID=A0ABD1UNC3_9LAMI
MKKGGALATRASQFAETLGEAPNVAAANPNGDPSTGQSPLVAPPLGDLFGVSIGSQTLAPAVLKLDPSRRALPASSSPLAASYPPPFQEMPISAMVISCHLIAPEEVPALFSLSEPDSIGLQLDPSVQPRVALDTIAVGSKGAPTPAPATLRVHLRHAISSTERSMRKSFASVLQSAPDSACHRFMAKEPFLHRGEPALTITTDEEASLAEPFKFTLVVKFSHRKPRMVEVRNSFQKFRFAGEFKIGLIDFKHILIHLTHEDDYSHLFLKPLWFIMGCPMRVLKWTCDFHPDAESLIAPVWISFPLLLVRLRAKEFLFALSKLVGIPLRIDETTADLLRPSEDRVCVEVNLEHMLPDRV